MIARAFADTESEGTPTPSIATAWTADRCMLDESNCIQTSKEQRGVLTCRRRGRTEIKICANLQILEEPKSGTCHQAVLLCL